MATSGRDGESAENGIRRLLADYGHSIDNKDWEHLGTLFSPDGVFDVSAGGAVAPYNGPAEVTAGFRRRSESQPISHHSTNELIAITEMDDGQ